MGVLEKIRELEDEYKKTQKNKATEHHLGILKAKIAKLKRSLISKKSSKGSGFTVKKSGNASVALIGFPSVGKSTLLSALTGAKSKVGAYAFTTLTCIPGIMHYEGAQIQILDLPGIIKGAKEGKGRGREVIAAARASDLILIVIDAKNINEYKAIEKELEGVGIRLNKKPKDIHITKKIRGGIVINTTKKLTKISNKTIVSILNEYGIHNADVVIRDDITVDELIDYLEKNRVYIPVLYVVNKIDENKEIEKRLLKHFIPISAKENYNIEELKRKIYEKLDFIRIYTKKKGEKPDLNEPLMVRKGSTVKDVCQALHRDLLKEFKYALIWGSSKHPEQRVGLDYKVKDKDIIQIVKK